MGQNYEGASTAALKKFFDTEALRVTLPKGGQVTSLLRPLADVWSDRHVAAAMVVGGGEAEFLGAR